jgi:Cof subfamily protein (haloacid dehalogenase superfamily)
MTGKLIFLDIDGTLTLPGSNVPPDSALMAVRKAQKAGNRVFLCTGRNYAMLSPLLVYGFDGMVAGAGGYVTVGEEVIFDCPMDEADTKEALEILHRNGVFCTIEAKDVTYGDENLGDFLAGQSEGNSEIERWRKALSSTLNIRPMSEYDGRPIYKIVIMCLREEQLREAREALEDRYNFCLQEVAAHSCINGELINRKYDKGRGILRVCEHLGVPVSRTYGFGDSMNDLEMIQTVGTSVCMENGAEALKAISDLVCPPVEKDGLAAAFDELGLFE